MIRGAWRLLHTEVHGMHAAAYLLGASALISALLALLRDRIFAHTFGAGEILDVYFAAFRIPDLLFVLVASLFSAYVLIPEIARRGDQRAIARYLNVIFLGYGILMVLISVLAFFAAPYVLKLFYGNLYDGAYHDEFLFLTRLLLLQPIFLGASNIFAAVTQHTNRYALYALTPLIYNASIIIGVLLLYPHFSLAGIGIGVVCGALLHAGIQIPSAMRTGFVAFGAGREMLSALWETIRVSLPRTLALSAGQMLIFALLAMASAMERGSIAITMLALNLQAVPLSIIGASYSVAAFPALSKMFARGDMETFVDQIVAATRHIIFWSLPMMALFIVLRAHIVRAVLGSGAFDWTDTKLTAGALALFITALLPQSLSLLFARGFYATGRSYLPLFVATVGGGVGYITALFLLNGIQQGDLALFMAELLRVPFNPSMEVLALPLAYAVSAWVGCIVLVAAFEWHFRGVLRGIARTVWEAATAAGIGGAAAYTILFFMGEITPLDGLVPVITHALVAGIGGIFITVSVYALVGSRELREMTQTLMARVRPAAHPSSSEEQLSH